MLGFFMSYCYSQINKHLGSIMRQLLLVAAFISITSCLPTPHDTFSLPEPISNNAVASAEKDGQIWLYSFNGLLKGKNWQDVSSNAYAIQPSTGETKMLTPVPGNKGRLASIAATVNNKIYIFGGYTVEQDHSEVSTPEVYRFDPVTENYQLVTQMPTPVDDSVALVYQDRYIYLISGWHNDGNVNLVQILDTKNMSWLQATPYPGSPVFGHAAGIVDNKIIVSDGVKVLKVVDGKRQYGMSHENYYGEIDKNNITQIRWKKIAQHPGPARYRMAATGSSKRNQIIFAAGSDNPYNYNGIGYNGIPSEPNDIVFAFDFSDHAWKELVKQVPATMDHRALLEVNNQFYIVGGMLGQQKTTNRLSSFSLKK